MRRSGFVLVVASMALLVLAGCSAPRVLVRPRTVEGPPDHIYFVEQTNGQSGIVKCDIQPDNSVTCSKQYALQ